MSNNDGPTLTANVLAWGFPLTVFLVLAVLERMVRLRRLRRQRVYANLAALSWVQFEQVIADAFRRHGYRVRETGGRHQPDGGVDVVLLPIIRAGLDGAALVLPEPPPLRAPSCPACTSEMVRRTAQRGALAGRDFWGCSRYPACRGTVNILDDAAAVG